MMGEVDFCEGARMLGGDWLWIDVFIREITPVLDH